MFFNIQVFTEILNKQVQQKSLTEKTLDGYVRCIRKLEKECKDKEGSSAVVLEAAVNKICEGNNQRSKYISAIKKYEREVLNSPQLLLYGEPLMRLRQKQKYALKGKKLSNTETSYSHKINALNDKRLKLGLRLQKQSGLRISEISDLTKSDIIFYQKDKAISLKVRKGKGRKARDVHVLQDDYLFEHLRSFVTPLGEKEKLFYTPDMMIKEAGKNNIKTHDLRRINARQRFRKERDEGAGRREARSAVSKELGHSKPKITNVYLGDEWEEEEQENE